MMHSVRKGMVRVARSKGAKASLPKRPKMSCIACISHRYIQQGLNRTMKQNVSPDIIARISPVSARIARLNPLNVPPKLPIHAVAMVLERSPGALVALAGRGGAGWGGVPLLVGQVALASICCHSSSFLPVRLAFE